MFTYESRFVLEPDDKRIKIWREQGTRNQPQNNLKKYQPQKCLLFNNSIPSCQTTDKLPKLLKIFIITTENYP